MHSLNGFPPQPAKPFIRIWNRFWRLVPEHSKRLCVLASLYVQLTQCSDDDVQQLDKVNTTMGLSRDTRSLRLPAVLARLIWRDTLTIDKVDLRNEEHYINRLVRRTPCWLWYADAETRRHDIRKLLSICTLTNHQSA